MTRWILRVTAILAIVALNVLFLDRALQFSRIYPFGRLLAGNALTFGLGEKSVPWPYGSEIIGIDGTPADSGNILDLLSAAAPGKKISVTVRSDAATYGAEFVRSAVNREVLWFFLLLLLCADLQFLWGFMVHFIHPHRYLPKLMVYFTFLLGMFNLFLIDLFSYRHWVVLLLASGIGVVYTGVVIGYNLTGRRISRSSMMLVLASGGMLAGLALFMPGLQHTVILQRLFFGYLVLCSLMPLLRLVMSMARSRNIYLLRRNGTIVLCMIAGYVAPLALFAAWTYADMPLPVYLLPCFMLALPLCVGVRLLENNFFNIRVYLGRGMAVVSINIIISFIAAFMLFFIANSELSTMELSLYYGGMAVAVSWLLWIKHTLNLKINQSMTKDRDRYAGSLQNIAELVSSPVDLALKLEKIYQEIRGLVGASTLRLVLFGEKPSDYRPALDAYLEYAGIGTEMYTFFRKNRNIILRYSLIINYEPEEQVYNFMCEQNAELAVPLLKGKQVTGLMLIGGKNGRDFFPDEEVNYLQTVSMQLYHLVENDRLFNEYIVKRRYERELDIASFIQMRLFPKQVPRRRGLHINYFSRPYIKVTGDYFDFINIDRDRTAVVIGDVSGHGLSASMILSMTSSIVHAMLREKKSIERAVDEVNHFLNYRYNGVDLISLFIGVYNKATRELVYVNAGHCAPVLIRSGQKGVSFLEGRSKILGADPSANYFSSRFSLGKNDEMILYTDGLVEIYHEKTAEHYGEKKFLDLISRNADRGIDEKVKAIAEYINGVSSEAINDDITVIGIKVL